MIPLHTRTCPRCTKPSRDSAAWLDEFPDRVLLGEIYLPIERLVAYYGRELDGTHLPFNFALLEAPWRARDIAKLIDDYEAALPRGGWPNWVLGNHDQPRIAGRVGRAQARIAAMLLLTLRGTPTIYYGDEIGMPQVPIPPDRVRDRVRAQRARHRCGRYGRAPRCSGRHAPRVVFSSWSRVAGGDGFGTDNVDSSDSTQRPSTISTAADRGAPASPSLRVGHYRRSWRAGICCCSSASTRPSAPWLA